MFKITGTTGLFATLLLLGSAISAEQPIPELTGRVVDKAGVLSARAQTRLTGKLEKLEKEQGSQVVVLIVDTIEPEVIEQYSIRVVEKWKLGRKDIDDGVLLIVAMKEKRVRIEVGYGLEGAIPDIKASRIIREQIVPEFKKGNFEAGIENGVDSIIALIRGEDLPAPVQSQNNLLATGNQDLFVTQVIFIGIGSVFMLVAILVAFAGKYRWTGFLVTGIALLPVFGLGILTGLWFIGFFVGGVVSFILSIFMAIGTTPASAVRTGRGSTGSWSSTVGGGWSGGSGGGFSGGFSGGGGGFGGGGASGGW